MSWRAALTRAQLETLSHSEQEQLDTIESLCHVGEWQYVSDVWGTKYDYYLSWLGYVVTTGIIKHREMAELYAALCRALDPPSEEVVEGKPRRRLIL